MIIYTYQTQSLIDEINSHGHAFVEFTKTNLYRQTQIPGKNMEAYHEAYVWMGIEKYDIQAAFPVIMKDWIKNVEEV